MDLKLNLGCGRDIRAGYLNVDFREMPCTDQSSFQLVNLKMIPWPWHDAVAQEILMLDFLEHFEYRLTDEILSEAWRVLEPGGVLCVQVPDFEQCSRAILRDPPYECNRCGWTMHARVETSQCPRCGQTSDEIASAAVRRLYGGQDYPGNYHHTAFTIDMMIETLKKGGFGDFKVVERNENGETFRANWNFKLRAKKRADVWNDE